MQFRVLGALEVWHDGDRVRIEGAEPAKALAVLLLEANRTLPVGRLIDALWDGEPPATAKRQVQNHLAALRREWAARGRDPIERIGDGYRLATDDLDWSHFQCEVARAREHGRRTGVRSPRPAGPGPRPLAGPCAGRLGVQASRSVDSLIRTCSIFTSSLSRY